MHARPKLREGRPAASVERPLPLTTRDLGVEQSWQLVKDPVLHVTVCVRHEQPPRPDEGRALRAARLPDGRL
jgi:hypothetical protein